MTFVIWVLCIHTVRLVGLLTHSTIHHHVFNRMLFGIGQNFAHGRRTFFPLFTHRHIGALGHGNFVRAITFDDQRLVGIGVFAHGIS